MKRNINLNYFAAKQAKLKQTRRGYQAEEEHVVGNPLMPIDFLSIAEEESNPGVAFLTAPVPSQQFIDRSFQVVPLHIQRNDDYYAGLFSLENLWASLVKKAKVTRNEDGIRLGSDVLLCRVLKDRGIRVNLELEEEQQLLDVGQLEKYMSQGYTVQAFQPQRFDLPLARLMSQLESEFCDHWGANSYVTPANSAGLAAHYDDVEVFILQIEGTKRWRVYEPTKVLPSDYSVDFLPSEVAEHLTLYLDIVLTPGDLLYLPRGWIHQAETTDSLSHHVTLSTFQKHTYRELVSAFFESALDDCWRSDSLLHAGLPLDLCKHGSFRNGSAISQKVEEMAQKVISKYASIGRAVDKLSVDFISTRLPPVDELTETRLELEVAEGDGGPQLSADEQGDIQQMSDADDCDVGEHPAYSSESLIRLAVDPSHMTLFISHGETPAGKVWMEEPVVVIVHSQNNLFTQSMSPEAPFLNSQSGNRVSMSIFYESALRLLVNNYDDGYMPVDDLPFEDAELRDEFLAVLDENGLLESLK